MTDIISKYFPHLSQKQMSQFEALQGLYGEWNAKINVISRKDIDNLYLHHILHSLAIAKFIDFKKDTNVLDFGTGGGFPAYHWLSFFPTPTSNSSTERVRKYAWPMRWRTPSDWKTCWLSTYGERKRKESSILSSPAPSCRCPI